MAQNTNVLSKRLHQPQPPPQPAAGLHDPGTVKTYYWHDVNGPAVIGRTRTCWIQLRDDPAISKRHAVLQVQLHGAWIEDMGSTNGVLLNQQLITEPYLVEVGMQVSIGGADLYAVDRFGRVPIVATTQAEFRSKAERIYGNAAVASERIGCSPNTVRRAR